MSARNRPSGLYKNKFIIYAMRKAFLPVLWIGTWVPAKSVKVVCVPTYADFNYRMRQRLLSEKAARKLLAMTDKVTKDSMTENAIHVAHAVIGLHQLARNDVDGAGKSLVESADTPGSPQLSSFGPSFLSFSLANGLLKIGQRDTVLQFLQYVKAFWQIEYGQKKVTQWTNPIRNGHTPELQRWN